MIRSSTVRTSSARSSCGSGCRLARVISRTAASTSHRSIASSFTRATTAGSSRGTGAAGLASRPSSGGGLAGGAHAMVAARKATPTRPDTADRLSGFPALNSHTPLYASAAHLEVVDPGLGIDQEGPGGFFLDVILQAGRERDETLRVRPDVNVEHAAAIEVRLAPRHPE